MLKANANTSEKSIPRFPFGNWTHWSISQHLLDAHVLVSLGVKFLTRRSPSCTILAYAWEEKPILFMVMLNLYFEACRHTFLFPYFWTFGSITGCSGAASTGWSWDLKQVQPCWELHLAQLSGGGTWTDTAKFFPPGDGRIARSFVHQRWACMWAGKFWSVRWMWNHVVTTYKVTLAIFMQLGSELVLKGLSPRYRGQLLLCHTPLFISKNSLSDCLSDLCTKIPADLNE